MKMANHHQSCVQSHGNIYISVWYKNSLFWVKCTQKKNFRLLWGTFAVLLGDCASDKNIMEICFMQKIHLVKMLSRLLFNRNLGGISCCVWCSSPNPHKDEITFFWWKTWKWKKPLGKQSRREVLLEMIDREISDKRRSFKLCNIQPSDKIHNSILQTVATVEISTACL